jgi:hypothetical protein
LSAACLRAEVVGIWHFDGSTPENPTQVANARPQGGGLPAVLQGFDPKLLAGVDVELAPFSVSRPGLQAKVEVAKAGWGTFKNIPDNGLNAGVNTPVGEKALALFSSKEGSWIHIPGLATALVGKSGSGVRTFGFAAWFLVPTAGDPPKIQTAGQIPMLRLGATDGRWWMSNSLDRIYTEDIGNGLGGARGNQFNHAQREAAAARWFHVVMTADATSAKFRLFVNAVEVNYAGNPAPKDGYSWPAGGALAISYKEGTDSDGLVMGRWLGGGAAFGGTMGIAELIILKDEALSPERVKYLYELGRDGKRFDGVWPIQKK